MHAVVVCVHPVVRCRCATVRAVVYVSQCSCAVQVCVAGAFVVYAHVLVWCVVCVCVSWCCECSTVFKIVQDNIIQ